MPLLEMEGIEAKIRRWLGKHKQLCFTFSKFSLGFGLEQGRALKADSRPPHACGVGQAHTSTGQAQGNLFSSSQDLPA